MKTSPASRIQSNLNELFQASISSGMPFIRLQLASDIEVLLSMERIEESHVISLDKITPLPAMPSCVIGMMNSRDHVFCIVDLAQLLSIPVRSQTPQTHQVITMNTSPPDAQDSEKIFLGLSVQQIQGITRVEVNRICPPSEIPAHLVEYVSGYIQEDTQKTLILDSQMILAQMKKLQTHQSF